jgi:hypothetical protein
MGDFFQDEENPIEQTHKEYQNPYEQNPYGETQENPYGRANGGTVGSGFGIAALVLGIVSLVFFCSCLTYITAPLAIIFGIVQLVKSKKEGKGLAIAGLITGCIALAACIAFWVLAMTNMNLSDSVLKQYGDYDFEDPDSIEQFIEDYSNDFGEELDGDEIYIEENGGYKPL